MPIDFQSCRNLEKLVSERSVFAILFREKVSGSAEFNELRREILIQFWRPKKLELINGNENSWLVISKR